MAHTHGTDWLRYKGDLVKVRKEGVFFEDLLVWSVEWRW